jgi:hypothetical protein
MLRSFTVYLVILLAALTASPALSQSRGAPDAISGTWTGTLMLSASKGTPVTFQLKFDGKSAVSGTFTGLPNPGDVKSGTFDPKSGALKLQLGKQGAVDVLLSLDGKVVKGIATGQFTGEASGDFKLEKK